MTIVEAFSVGTPVIGSDLGNVGSILRDEKNGWKFDSRSIEALCEAVMKSHNIIDRLIECKKQYDYDTNYNVLYYIYDNCVEWR